MRELSQTAKEGAAKKLEIGSYGQLQTLQWAEEEAVSSLAGDQVEIDTGAVGMNFKVGTPPLKSA